MVTWNPFRNMPHPSFLQRIPRQSLLIIALLIVINVLAWAAVAIVLHFHPKLSSYAALSYTLGLRHALDADHISAIDLMTRRLIASGQRPATVGTFFSLGHSTNVIITCIVVAATSGALRKKFDGFQRVGNIIGTSVSAAVLILLCIGNGWILHSLVKRLKEVLKERQCQTQLVADDQQQAQQGQAEARLEHEMAGNQASPNTFELEGAGLLARLFKKIFKVIDQPWKMYPLGVVFGLGFDTSSEVALLGIASLQGLQGTSIWLILIFPILFTAGMCLVDTTDGALMMALYTSKAFSRDVVAILYYSIVLTAVTVVVSAFIGIIQILSLVQNVANPSGSFWHGVEVIGNHFDIIGGSICGLFLILGLASVVAYSPWRRRMEKRRAQRMPATDFGDEEAARIIQD